MKGKIHDGSYDIYGSEEHSIPPSRMASPRAMQTIKMEAGSIVVEMKEVLDSKSKELAKVMEEATQQVKITE